MSLTAAPRKAAFNIMDSSDTFILCVDLDGVVADYNGFFRPFCAERLGIPVDELGPQTSWNYEECGWGIRNGEHFLELHTAAVVEGRMFRKMPVVPGASEALWELSDEGFHIRVVTHRLVRHWQHDLVMADTASWLQQPAAHDSNKPMIPYRDIAFLGKKADLSGDVIVDDAPHNVLALRAARQRGKPAPEPIIFSHPYNEHIDGPRAYDWEDVKRLVRAKRDWLASNPLAADAGPAAPASVPWSDAA